ncbi:dihydrolipoamide acetyltransferase family protein [Pseudonocardia sp. CA-107938]|uniref:dihydrolipoamide acetyltransferase family protein n=1 Tax=Pseudonocardia sp. CA-107938 TaxID=3240021 RepID=UPI003D922F5A
MRREFAMPDVGEGLTEAEIIAWQVAPGDTVTVNQILCEIETAKAAVELPSPWAGTVGELLVEPGRTVDVGSPIIVIETAEAAPEPAAPAAPAKEEQGAKIGEAGKDGRIATLVGYGPRPGSVTRRPRKNAAPAPTPAPAAEPEPQPVASNGAVPLAKPPVRKLAKDLGIDLRTVTPSGADGIITRADVEAHATAPARPAVSSGGERREPIRGVRKATAAAVTGSAFTAPHVTEFLTIDITATMELRDRLRADRGYRDVKLTPLAFVAKAVCLAAARTPDLNARWDEAAGEIVYYDRVQLGIAAATPRGLIVPKIRDADTLSLRELAVALTELTDTARSGKTPPADLVGGTFTITNVGVFGVDTGTPILNPGEAGILAVGAIKPMPWVVDGELAVRTVCQLALSFDHRLVDGEQGSRFLADVGALLTDPGLALTW